jgi:DNA-binding transcriptional MerR regulator
MNSEKSENAFRTISEVGSALDLKAHVLRFWESKFEQIQPVKRAGGRRYFRPEDVELIAGIKFLLHEQGMTIKGVQKLIKDEGVAHIKNAANTQAAAPTQNALSLAQRSRLEAARQSLMQAKIMLEDEA